MQLCQYHTEFEQVISSGEVDWSVAGREYDNLQEMPSFIAQQKQHFVSKSYETEAEAQCLKGKQHEAYQIVHDHYHDKQPGSPLRMIISGTAGTGKSYLIKCLKKLLGDCLRVTAPTGGAAYNINGYTLHSLLSIPVSGDFKDLEGQRLSALQESLCGVEYLIIDEMSMVGRKLFGQVDKRLRQAFPQRYLLMDMYILFTFDPSCSLNEFL